VIWKERHERSAYVFKDRIWGGMKARQAAAASPRASAGGRKTGTVYFIDPIPSRSTPCACGLRVAANAVAPVQWVGHRRPDRIEVFGIDVEYFHNYFVGTSDNAKLVHNRPDFLM
jgi:hypothetical protein